MTRQAPTGESRGPDSSGWLHIFVVASVTIITLLIIQTLSLVILVGRVEQILQQVCK